MPQQFLESEPGCARVFAGLLVGFVAGGVLGLLGAQMLPTPNVPNMDGLNRWAGHVFLVGAGIVLGSMGGIVAAISRYPGQIALVVALAIVLLTIALSV